ncbi:lytic transglycosylase domain-containing protein [Schumannella soli]|uniref:aggregation-promoting factor C-terminal-like domain-containing protein n=1 Tax=Schumannella soli TaxID=2590779 RepID=UPI0021037290|nr:lytic transglycosylase domain-containing protein [Schumannella soli]
MSSSRSTPAPGALATRPRFGTSVAIPRHIRRRHSLPLFAGLATLAFVLVSIVDPYSGAYASATVAPGHDGRLQTYQAGAAGGSATQRDGYQVIKPQPVAPAAPKGGRAAPAAGTPDPGSAKAIAHDMVVARGWGEGEYDCLVSLWNKESHWNVYAHNSGSGAYGIPQALPGSKMASAGPDWQTNPATQITWGLGYITGRYGTPCGAWAKSQSSGWY